MATNMEDGYPMKMGGYPGAPLSPDVKGERPMLPVAGPYYPVQRRKRSPCCCCCLCLVSILTALVVIVGLFVLIVWLVVHPRALQFSVEDVHVTSPDTSTGDSTYNTDVSFRLVARNPNKHIGVFYDNIAVKVQTDGATIGDGTLPPFYQGHKNTTTIDGDVRATGVSSGTINRLTGSNASRVPLYMTVTVKARYKVGSSKSKTTIKAHCNIEVDLTLDNGSQTLNNFCKTSS